MKKTIVVTGASRGIGLAIVEKFAKSDWNIGFCSKNPTHVVEASNYLRSINSEIKILAQCCDMSSKNEVLSFANACLNEFDSIDVLVNNAGMFKQGNLSNASYEDDLEGQLNINLNSAYWMGKVIIPAMITNQSGHIFNISSIAGIKDYDHGGSYTVTKFALTGYTKQLRNELKLKNIRVTGVYPGAVLTDSWAGVDLPTQRFIQTSDVAELIYTCTQLSRGACVEDIILRPQEGDI